ncbi:SpaA isopeptide-forming pilin-related protein [Roseburia hominis]
MQEERKQEAAGYLARNCRRQVWKRMVGVLACVVVFCTTYALILPAVTKENTAYCGFEEHKHGEECYEEKLTCGQEETKDTVHEHSSACYGRQQKLTCGQEENSTVHTHVENCIVREQQLVCQDMDPEHHHAEECYETVESYICGFKEGETEGHIHTDKCYSAEEVLQCGKKEGEKIPGHTHTDECYTKALICEKEEHTHELECYSDPEADLETAKEWESSMADMKLTGDWRKDVVAVAESQLGYRESEKNYTVDEKGNKNGYTRYGAWYGEPYGGWDAMFVSFCLHYADVEGYPVDSSCQKWIETLNREPYYEYFSRGTYEPQPGDLVFFQTDDDDKDGADHIGIVVESIPKGTQDGQSTVSQGMEETAQIRTIEGDNPNCVQYVTHNIDDPNILGYGKLPENPKLVQSEEKAVQNSSLFGMPVEAENNASTLNVEVSPTPAPDYIGTIPDSSVSTEWQITKEPYAGRGQENKTGFDDNHDGEMDVYLQKNAVPTDVENEFLVYLSMDKKMTWEQFLHESSVLITSTNKYAKEPVGTVVQSVAGMSSELMSHYQQGVADRKYYVNIQVYQNQDSVAPLYTYYDWRYGETPNCSNGTVFLNVPGLGYMVAQHEVNYKYTGGGSGNPFELKIYLDSFPLSSELVMYNTVFESVTDQLGDYVEFMELVSADGDFTYDDDQRQIIWKPADNEDVISQVNPGSMSSVWEENITQLVYRVKLNVEKEGFISCADTLDSKESSIQEDESYKVNNEAILSYHTEPLESVGGERSETFTVAYPVPEVRGMLYNITFSKENEKGQSLEGAVFGIYQSDGTTPVENPDGTPCTITTVAGEISRFRNLPYGTYVIKELNPPAHYSVPEINTWTVPLCYTKDRDRLLGQDQADPHNLRYTGNDNGSGRWVIVNHRGEYTYRVKVVKTDANETVLKDAQFSITNPEEPTETLTGTTDESGCIVFPGVFHPNIEYTLSELAAPAGYNLLPADIHFILKDEEETDTQTVELVNADQLNHLVTLTLSEDADGPILKIQVINQAGYVLPATGGPGTTLFTLSGLCLIAGALMCSSYLQRRRKRRVG